MNTKCGYEHQWLTKLSKHGVRVVFALLLLLPVAAWAGGVVTNCTEAALRAAMAGGGTVTLACDGTITLSSTITNNLDAKLDATGHQVVISGANRVGVFVVDTNISFSLANLTVARGGSEGGSAILNLGGSVNLASVAFLSNSAMGPFQSNPTASGGALWNRGGTVHATNCSFVGNTAQTIGSSSSTSPDTSALGGAIRNEAGHVALRACAFVGNRASGGTALQKPGPGPGDRARGGAIHNSGTVTMDLCTFTGNSATGGGGAGPWYLYSGTAGGEGSGGAIFNEGTLRVDRATFCGNAATGGTGGAGGTGDPYYGILDGYAGGGGGNAYGGAICGGTMWIARSTLVSNVVTAGSGGSGGGGVSSPPGDPHFGGNGAAGGNGGSGGYGGAVGGLGSLVNCTIAFNSGSGGAGGQGGGGGYGFTSGGSGGAGGNGGSAVGGVGGMGLTNCTVAWNRGNAGRGGAGGTLQPGSAGGVPGANGTDGGAWGGTASSTLVNTLIASNTPAGGDTYTDPKLGPLVDNGGPTLTMALLPGSPAIDAGNTSLAPRSDQRGFPRPAGLAADIGAFEYGSVMPTLSVSRAGANGLNILGSGNAGQFCRLLSSPDLLSWLPLATNQIGSDGTTLFYDTCAPGSACRFYRLVMP
jgi:hypothetical protein